MLNVVRDAASRGTQRSKDRRASVSRAGAGRVRSPGSATSILLLPAIERGNLDQIAAGVVQHGDGRAGNFGRRHGELRASSLHAVVLALHVVYIEHGGWLALLEHRLLVGLSRRVVIGSELQLDAVWLLG